MNKRARASAESAWIAATRGSKLSGVSRSSAVRFAEWLPREGSTQRDVLASDADRERTVRALREHFAAGRLDRTEFERRIEDAYGTRTRGELRRLLSDLPRSGGARIARRFYSFQRELLPYHTGAFVTINGALAGIWAATGEGRFWPAAVLAPTTVLIAFHAYGSRWLRRRLAARRAMPHD
jgi:hypothetical protein